MVAPVALPVQRSPRQTLHHVWAPKLRRIVMLTGQAQLHFWAMLEAHPGVTQYCERPASPDAAQTLPIADFWAIRDGSPSWLRLAEAPVEGAASLDRATSHEGVELISPDELKRHRFWIRNWLSLLPYLSTTSPVGLEALKGHVVEVAGNEATFDEIERHFGQTDSVLTRTAVIAALHAGLLVSEDLQHKPWDRSTRVCRASPRARHAPQ